MSCGAIEVHDAGLLVVADGRLLAPPSPGYAVLDGELLTGTEARGRCRLRPRHSQHRFWGDLGTTPLGRPFPDGLSAADLAHAHLQALWDRVGRGMDEVLLAVPGSTSEPELGLMLGIARASRVPVVGLVDAAVAAASTGDSPRGHLLHLDLQLHRTVLTEMTSGDQVARQSVRALNGTGVRSLEDAWVRRLAELFVTRTRFDPLHAAATEQALFGSIAGIAERLDREPSCPVAIEAAGRTHTVEVTRKEMVEAVAPAYEAILRLVRTGVAGGTPTVLLSGRTAGLPGLEERLAAAGSAPPIALPLEAAGIGACARRDTIRAEGEALPFVTRLPREATRPAAGPPEPDRALPATHLLHDGMAHRIPGRPFRIGNRVPTGEPGLVLSGVAANHCSLVRDGDRLLLTVEPGAGVSRNGRTVQETLELRAGDILRLGDPEVELRMLRMGNGEGDGTA